ncbi:glutamate-5-semialdehyde dehydrogenase [Erysipelothrix urinaevulpis]|uniref:glutamate-5-semialdehyde dehydrogenase n=1 Tax=Erysipelothrix urinaevulpis TaxID=2683717 RepID=UPI001357D869|nr:glutamate-5-semialdehyde dehydrogenase [Erysipelothrix urinaevulpis]
METIGLNAKKAATESAQLSASKKNDVLKDIASALLHHQEDILKANKKDLETAQSQELDDAMIDRLKLNPNRIKDIADGLVKLSIMDDPLQEILETYHPENGLIIEKVSVPLGVIGIIYESRPNVTVDAFGLCFKAGNTVILKGGKEAIHSNLAFEAIIQKTLSQNKLNPFIIQCIQSTDRQATQAMMKMDQYIDVLIPRGSQGLIKAVLKHSTIPVIETGAGNCHIYVDKDADLTMALAIIENAKCQRLGVCNAMESLVVHEAIAKTFLPMLAEQLHDVEFFADTKAQAIVPSFTQATPLDFYTEYLSKAMSVKTVSSLQQAVDHINEHNTKHSDAIITNNQETSDMFTRLIDSSTVYVNASTRFTDGSEFGFGAEIGISTQKLHARGPMGLKQLTSYKYIVKGKGQTRV